MSYCLNPHCPKPSNPPGNNFCQTCGTKLRLSDRYRALKIIGQGGFGRTFLAEDEYKPSRPRCVIKQFYPEGQNNAGKAVQLFEQEAIRLDQLGRNSQIPELYAYLTQDSRHYIVQEYIDGQNLADELAAEGAFSESKIRQLLQDLLPVLQFIHDGEVIHRDIKPENIIRRRRDSKLVLVDFGAAKYATTTALAKTGTSIGSAEYVAPEQMRGKAIFASDIYSLGVTCLHLLTQLSPFDLFDMHEHTWVWRQYLTQSVSLQLGQVLDRMVENSLRDRYPSTSEILTDLRSRNPIPPTIPTLSPKGFNCIETLRGHSDAVFSVAFSPNGKLLASGSGFWDKTLKLWEVEKGHLQQTLSGHTDGIRIVAFSPQGQLLASGGSSTDKSIKLWSVKTGKEVRTLTGHLSVVYALAFYPVEPMLVSGSQDTTLKVWNYLTGQEMMTLAGHSDWIRTVDISPDGQLLASGGNDRNVKLWSALTGKELAIFREHLLGVSSIKFSPNGQLLASGSDDATIKLWDVRTRQEIRVLKGHSSAVYSVAFSPDGEYLVSGSLDTSAKVWRVKTGEALFTLEGHTRAVNSVRFSPDGRLIASCSWDKTINLWRSN